MTSFKLCLIHIGKLSLTSRSDAIICRLDIVKNKLPNSLTFFVLISFSKKPSGSQPSDPACFCCKQALMCVAEASTARLSFAAWAGCTSLVAEASICLTPEKAASLSLFHSTAVGPFRPPQSVSGFSALAAPGRKRR